MGDKTQPLNVLCALETVDLYHRLKDEGGYNSDDAFLRELLANEDEKQRKQDYTHAPSNHQQIQIDSVYEITRTDFDNDDEPVILDSSENSRTNSDIIEVVHFAALPKVEEITIENGPVFPDEVDTLAPPVNESSIKGKDQDSDLMSATTPCQVHVTDICAPIGEAENCQLPVAVVVEDVSASAEPDSSTPAILPSRPVSETMGDSSTKTEKQFTCKHCLRVFNRLHNMSQHQIACLRIKERGSSCTHCGLAITNSRVRKTHQRRCPAKLKKPVNLDSTAGGAIGSTVNVATNSELLASQRNDFACTFCMKVYTSVSNLKRHEKLHRNDDLLKCRTCLYRFTNHFSLIRHIKNNSCFKTTPKTGSRVMNRSSPVSSSALNLVESSGRGSSNDVHGETLQNSVANFGGLLICEGCNWSYLGELKMAKHRKVCTGVPLWSKKQHQCEFCARSYGDKRRFTEHVRLHSNPNLFKCNRCSYRASSDSGFISHKLTCRAKLTPATTSKAVEQSHSKLQHKSSAVAPDNVEGARIIKIRVFGGKVNWKCSLCLKRFEKIWGARGHLSFHAPKRYRCVGCRTEFVRLDHCKLHWARCPPCQDTDISESQFFEKIDIAQPIRSQNGMDQPITKRDALKQPIKTLVIRPKLVQVVRKTGSGYRVISWKCNKCKKFFDKQQTGYTHLKSHKPRFSCSNCSLCFAEKQMVDDHVMTCAATSSDDDSVPAGRKRKLCDGRSGTVAKRLKTINDRYDSKFEMPVKILGTSSYKCSVCSLTYHSRRIWRHLESHTADLPHKCECCGCSFTTKGALTKHLGKHPEWVRQSPKKVLSVAATDDAPIYDSAPSSPEFGSFSVPETAEQPPAPTPVQESQASTLKNGRECSYCHYWYDSTVIESHMASHTAGYPHRCDVCGATFKLQIGLRTHATKKHPGAFDTETKDSAVDSDTDGVDGKFGCVECEATYNTLDRLEHHFVTRHPHADA